MSGRILVVDDLLPNIKLLEAKLATEYYDVLTAKSGKEALDILDKNEIDVVLLDVMMPEMDGFEVCKKIKNNYKTQYIPVVMVTALSDVESRVTGLKAGADDFMTKPINDVALFARLRSLVRLKTLIDELHIQNRSNNEEMLFKNNENNNYKSAKIIIFDDDVAQSNRLKQTLSSFCSNIVIIQHCKDYGVQSLVDNDHDLVIISSQLSDISGLKLCSKIKNKLKNVPILLIVEEGENDLLVKAFDIGVDDYLLAPIDINEAVARVKTQIKKKKFKDALKLNVQKSVDLALKDGLTDCYNRRYLEQFGKSIIQDTVSKNRNLSLIMLDIDYFKKVNDNYGHQVGDEVLKQISKIITSVLSENDILIRYGGEEFLIILDNVSKATAFNKAEALRRKVAETNFALSNAVTLNKTISLGVSSLNQGDDIENIISRADKALYKAKFVGRNKAIVYE